MAVIKIVEQKFNLWSKISLICPPILEEYHIGFIRIEMI